MLTTRTITAGLLTAATAAPGFAIDPKPGTTPAAPAAEAKGQSGPVPGRLGRTDGFRFDFTYPRPSPYPAPVVTPSPVVAAPTPVVVGPAPAVYPAPQRPFRLGVTTYRGWGGGLVVAAVVPYSPAADVGLESGDVLVTANRRFLNSHYDLAAALTFSERRGGHLSLVVRSVRDGLHYQVDADIVPDFVIQGAPPVVMQGAPAPVVIPGAPRPAAEQQGRAAPAVQGKAAPAAPPAPAESGGKFGVKNVIRKQVAAPQPGK